MRLIDFIIILLLLAVAGWSYYNYKERKELSQNIEKQRVEVERKLSNIKAEEKELIKKDSIYRLRYNRKIDSLQKQLKRVNYTLRKNHNRYETIKSNIDSLNNSDLSGLPIFPTNSSR